MKKLISLVLSLCLALSLAVLPSLAYTEKQQNTADALNQLGLFLGTDKGYELDNSLLREQGLVLFVRMIGKEAEAKAGTWQHPFTDVPEWLAPYVGYAYEKKLTFGTSDTTFSGKDIMTQQIGRAHV